MPRPSGARRVKPRARALDRSPSPRALDAPQHRESDAGPRRIVNRMVCALLDRYHLLGALAVDLRFRVGAIAVFAPGAVHWDRHGSRAIAHLATGDGSRARILEDANACLQLHKEPGHAHRLRPRDVPRRARNGFAPSLREMSSAAPRFAVSTTGRQPLPGKALARPHGVAHARWATGRVVRSVRCPQASRNQDTARSGVHENPANRPRGGS